MTAAGALFASAPRFDGADVQAHDHIRLAGQLQRVYQVLVNSGTWETVAGIAATTGDPEPSVSAQLRNLRKARFGGYDVRRERRGNLSVYKLFAEVA